MQYLCPKCGNFMTCISTASIPAYTIYECMRCNYRSKSTRDLPLYTILPRELWSDGDREDECDD